ncbi:MAG: peptidoglycan DD-metalloendopeptidase family protein [Candidatus Thiodiazotropha sp.]
MDDFKSYTLSRQTPRGQVIKRLLLAGLFLVLLAAGFLYLISTENEPKAPTNTPQPSATTPQHQAPKKVIVPLDLPGQSSGARQPEKHGPVSPSNGFIAAAEAREPAPTVQPVPSTTEAATETTDDNTARTPDTPKAAVTKTHQVVHKIQRGDSLSTIFKQYGLSANLLYRIVHSSDTAQQLTDIRPGETIYMDLDDSDQLLGLRLEYSKVRSLQITAKDESFNAAELSREVEHRVNHASGIIDSSLYETAKQAGLSETLIMELAEIFGWDIDFALEIRAGDHFTVIYEEDYLDGEKLDDGPILAAEFVNQGHSYRALRYVDDTGRADYFTPEGRSMRKAFLRAPVDFRRISSGFTQERWHPVLGKKRPHRGVDYAAKVGTPVKASGDGKIIFRGTKGGYGRTVILQHGQTYTTLYAHLSRYNKSVHKGDKVRQGQVIGYVGQSGLATGPHLHYEFRVNGVHRNPVTVKLPDAQPINKKYLADFQMKSQPLISQLEVISRTIVANAQ